jgi:hypothetical protein
VLRVRCSGFDFRIWQGIGLMVCGFEFRVKGLGCRVQDVRYRGSRLGVYILGCKC